MEAYHVIPLLTGLCFAVGALCIKRATTLGLGPWRTTFFSNLVLFLMAAPFWFFGEPIREWESLGMPLFIGSIFFVGQLLWCLAIHKGDVSLLTPLMGTKAVFVAFVVSIWLGEDLSPLVWVAAVLSAIAVLLLRGRSEAERKRVVYSLVLGLGCSIAYAVGDSAMQAFGSELGYEKLIAGTFSVVMAWSLVLIPLFRGPVSEISRTAWSWLLAGSALWAVQSCLMAYAVGVYGKAAVINVIYSSRGVWGVVLVWVVGHWFSNDEKALGGDVLGRRLIGALLLIVAIVAVMS
ncbi:EamA family transporter [Pelagicoccus mobilis]|uniref:EamA family transporter n=1 Tax=Pelagicoccus mobilis TaxID=415221 RepID=A0A934S6J3_9BACT|nr:EamA family transporter [Pelagicoccus mobilis]MBK1880647.1 EamA family transporter [Pelagicoccus mobilis]